MGYTNLYELECLGLEEKKNEDGYFYLDFDKKVIEELKEKAQYIVVREKGIVVCLIDIGIKKKKKRGQATCHPDDVFDEEIGKKIALAKATNKILKMLASKKRQWEKSYNNFLKNEIKVAESIVKEKRRIYHFALKSELLKNDEIIKLIDKEKEIIKKFE